jgi:hypothetical protein
MDSKTTESAVRGKEHAFSRLGQYPYRYIGYSENKLVTSGTRDVKPGTSCDYCATAIVDAYHFRSADNREFKVGCECVKKADDAGLINAIERDRLRITREKRRAKVADRLARLTDLMLDPKVIESLSKYPHPKGFVNRATGQPMTLVDWANWMIQNAGDTGRRQVESVIKEKIETPPETA